MLSSFLRLGGSAESLQHEPDHGDLDHGFAVFYQFLIVLAESPGMCQPGERAFYDPALAKQLKTSLLFQLPDNFQHPAAPATQPFDQLSGVTAIGPHQRNRGERCGGLDEQQLGSIAVLDGGGMHDDGQQ